MKISGQIEQIFSQAVALDQSGGLRNTIYVRGREIYILNFDHTVLMRFRLHPEEMSFQQDISFRANDYDSSNFEEKDGKIQFITKKGDFTRTKTCGTAERTPDEVKTIVNELLHQSKKTDLQWVELSRDILELLDQDLSHIEFSCEAGHTLKMVQRNIYSGGIIEVQEDEGKGLGLYNRTKLDYDFGPIGIKTGDFFALFSFQDILLFAFPKGVDADYVLVKSRNEDRMAQGKQNMTTIVASCIYDEIIKLKEVNHGRQESKIRRSK